MLDHILEDVARYGGISLFAASSFEQFNIIFKKFIRRTSMRKRRTFEETVRIINSSYKEADKAIHTTNEDKTSGLIRDGTKTSLQQVIDCNCLILDHLTTDGKKLCRPTFSGEFWTQTQKIVSIPYRVMSKLLL